MMDLRVRLVRWLRNQVRTDADNDTDQATPKNQHS